MTTAVCALPECRSRAIPWGWLALAALLVVLTASKSILYDTLDPDCFWHLRVADQLLRDGIGPIVDHLAFTSRKLAWTPYSWLGELFMRRVWLIGSYRAAIAVQAITIASIYAFLTMSCCARGASRLAVLIVLVAAAYLSLPYLSFRPATFAIAMLALAIWLLIRDRQMKERTRLLWSIVPLTAVMVNVHLFAFLVPALVFALFVGSLIERSDSWKRYGLLSLLCVLACLATPMLPGMLATMWFYQSADTMVAGPGIAELRPFYAGPLGCINVLLVVGGFVACVRRRELVRAGEWLWLAGAVVLLLRMGRFTPLFVLIAAPVVANALPAMNGAMLEKPLIRVLAAFLLAISVVKIVAGFPSKQTAMDAWLDRMGPDAPGYPCAAADYVADHVARHSGHVLNNFSWGGYLEWRLGPEYQAFMDGRTQVFPGSFWHVTCMGTPKELQRYLNSIPTDAAIVPVDKGRIRSAVIALGWHSVYADDRAAVFVPSATTVGVSVY